MQDDAICDISTYRRVVSVDYRPIQWMLENPMMRKLSVFERLEGTNHHELLKVPE